jgi:4-aminobutyrate aminotransferase
MVGTEIRNAKRELDKKMAKAIVKACYDQKMILLTCGHWDNTIRWIPPLIITEEQIADGLERFEKALKKATA